MGMEASSDSSSSGAGGAGDEERCCCDDWDGLTGCLDCGGGRMVGEDVAPFVDVEVDMGFVVGMSVGGAAFLGGAGVSSMVECLPVVQGGISRNSSKVRTRGLQHIHPSEKMTLDEALVWEDS